MTSKTLTLTTTRAPGRTQPGNLPPDLLEAAARRVGTAAALLCLWFGSSFVLALFLPGDLGIRGGDPDVSVAHAIAKGAVLIFSALLFLVSRQKWFSPDLLLKAGLVYAVVAAAALSFINVFPPPIDMTHALAPGIPSTAVVVLFFPLVVPAPPRVSLGVALAAAATFPACWLVAETMGHDYPNLIMGVRTLALVVCAFLSWTGALMVYRLSTDASEARKVGSYELKELLGKGGMGEVWHAEHALLARPAAVKLIRAERIQDADHAREALGRFKREARATSKLRSPHTIELFDFGMTEDHTFYYVMELLDGIDLQDFVDDFGPMPASRVVFVLKQVCHSLSEAHAHGLTHRDIKPGNIFIAHLGEDYDFVKVLDFGLVKFDEQTPEGAERLTAHGNVTGTPAFMAPEQVILGGVVDHRSDIYALGCVAYWLLCGSYPFEEGGAQKVMYDHVKTPPKPPSRRTERQIPEDLESLVLQCLAKAPEDRPQSARELAKALGALECAGRWDGETAEVWWRDHMPDRDGAKAKA